MPFPLRRKFYNRDPIEVARELLGNLLMRDGDEGLTVGRIVESEAYLATGDSASHSFRGQTPRNASMFGNPGHAYIYSIHARYCLNAVTESKDTGSAVLIRAVEPIEGIDIMMVRRGGRSLRELTRGPARLCEAFAIDRLLDGWDLTKGEQLWIAARKKSESFKTVTSKRVGVTSAHGLQLRFCIRDSQFVSRKA